MLSTPAHKQTDIELHRLLVKYAMTLLDTITRFYVKMDTKDKEPFFQEYNQPFQISIHIAIYRKDCIT